MWHLYPRGSKSKGRSMLIISRWNSNSGELIKCFLLFPRDTGQTMIKILHRDRASPRPSLSLQPRLSRSLILTRDVCSAIETHVVGEGISKRGERKERDSLKCTFAFCSYRELACLSRISVSSFVVVLCFILLFLFSSQRLFSLFMRF